MGNVESVIAETFNNNCEIMQMNGRAGVDQTLDGDPQGDLIGRRCI
jgi:hypothetical protein